MRTVGGRGERRPNSAPCVTHEPPWVQTTTHTHTPQPTNHYAGPAIHRSGQGGAGALHQGPGAAGSGRLGFDPGQEHQVRRAGPLGRWAGGSGDSGGQEAGSRAPSMGTQAVAPRDAPLFDSRPPQHCPRLEWYKFGNQRLRCLRITAKEEKLVRKKLQVRELDACGRFRVARRPRESPLRKPMQTRWCARRPNSPMPLHASDSVLGAGDAQGRHQVHQQADAGSCRAAAGADLRLRQPAGRAGGAGGAGGRGGGRRESDPRRSGVALGLEQHAIAHCTPHGTRTHSRAPGA